MTTIYKTFSELNDSQKQDVAQAYLNKQTVVCQNELVEFVLKQSRDEDNNAPFSHDDITNFNYFGHIEINGYSYELEQSERDEKLEFYEYLRDKADMVMDARYELLIDANDEQYDTLYAKHDKTQDNHSRLDAICDELDSMEFDSQPEIYTWFYCSEWLIRALEEKGQCTLDGQFWGRTCCGQSIVLDHVIQTIAFEYYTENSYNNHPESLNFIVKGEV
jgi:hypothetical protein